IIEAGTGACHAPVGILTDRACLGQEVEVAAVLDTAPTLHPCRERLVASTDEALVQAGQEAQRLRREDLVEALALRAEHLHPCIHGSSFRGAAGAVTPGRELFPPPPGAAPGAPCGSVELGGLGGADEGEGGRVGVEAVAMRSKYPVPTSRWCL